MRKVKIFKLCSSVSHPSEDVHHTLSSSQMSLTYIVMSSTCPWVRPLEHTTNTVDNASAKQNLMTHILYEQITCIKCAIPLLELKTNSTSFLPNTEPLSRNLSTIKLVTQRMQHHTVLLSVSDRDQRLRSVEAMLLLPAMCRCWPSN